MCSSLVVSEVRRVMSMVVSEHRRQGMGVFNGESEGAIWLVSQISS
jgi:hypothetical protein